MVNRIADRILNAVLPHTRAAAPCGASYLVHCYCYRGLRYAKSCRDCTGAGGGCTGCTTVTGTC
jgi:hypothetical protein